MLDRKLNKELRQRAWEVMQLSYKRAGIRRPMWARNREMNSEFLKIYKRAQIKNHFRFSYGKSCEFYQVDHIYPLHGEFVSGLHVPWNLHVIPATINIAKGIIVVEEYTRPKPKAGPNHQTRRFMEWFAESLETL
jgi:hypothetical protein